MAVQKGMEAVCRSMDNRIALRLGVPANLKELFAAAEDFGVPVLEDQFFLFWEEFRRKAPIELRRQTRALACARNGRGEMMGLPYLRRYGRDDL